MKKIIFITIALFTFSFVNAQETSFGLKAGLNIASFNSSVGEFNDITDSRIAFHVGGIVEFSFSDSFALQPEVLYNSVGASYNEGSTSFDYIIDYLSIPVIAKYYVADGFSLQAGPQVGFLLSAKAKDDEGEENFKSIMESLDFGLALGSGYKLDNGLFFEARYTLGLLNTWKDIDNEWIKNNTLQFSVGYLFN